MALDIMPIKQYQKQLTRLLCASNDWCDDLTGYEFETLVGFLPLRPYDELFLLCQSMFVRSFTIDYSDLVFWANPHSVCGISARRSHHS
jgi:hypothetical protein